MTDESGADVQHPRYDVTLSDGETTIGMMFADGRGRDDPTNIRRSPYPRTSTKINSGAGKYDDYQLPYKTIVQDNWIGGRASLNLEDDVTRFMDSYRLWTEQEKQACLAGLETYSMGYDNADGTVYRNMQGYMPGGSSSDSIVFKKIADSSRYIAAQFNVLADQQFLAKKLGMIVRRNGSPSGDLVLALWSDNGGAPESELAYGTVTIEYDCLDSTSRFVFVDIYWDLEDSTSYYVVAYQRDGVPDSENYWEIAVDDNGERSEGDTMESDDGVTWTENTYDPYFRLIKDTVYDFRFLDYKKGKYAITKSGYLWLNGDRGACKGAQSGNIIRDTDKTWENNEWANCIVMLVNGTGSAEDKPYRTIVSNTANTLSISGDDWGTTPDTTTEYVILGSNKWTLKESIGHTVTDIAVTDDTVYIAIGEDYPVHRYFEYVGDDGTYYDMTIAEGQAKANKLLSINSPDGWELWGSMNNHPRHGTCVWKAKVPNSPSITSDLYNLVANLFDGTSEMDEQDVAYVSQDRGDSGLDITVEAGFDTGEIVASKAIESIDITKGNKIGILMKASEATTSNDLDIILDDTPMCGRRFIPDKILFYDTEVLPTSVMKHRSFYRPTMVLYKDAGSTSADDKFYLEGNVKDGESTYKFNPSGWDYTKDILWISYPERMKGIYFNISGSAGGTAVGTLKYWNGIDWAAITVTADGTNNFTQSGLIYWSTIPVKWALGSNNDEDDYLASDRYHIKLEFTTANPASSFTIDYITCMGDGNSEAPVDDQFLEMKNIYDAHWSDYSREAIFYNNDSIYIRYPKRFNRVYWNISTGNNVGFETTPYVWDGSTWQEISSGWTDETVSSGCALGTTGAMYFNMPDCWQPGSPSYLNEYLSDTDFVLKIKLTATTSPMTTAYATSAVVIDKIILSDTLDEVYGWTSLDDMKDGDSETYDYINFDESDYLYVMFANMFDIIHFNIPSTDNDNNNAASMILEYFNGYTWVEFSSYTDGTSYGGKTLSAVPASKDMSFTKPFDWRPIAMQESEGYAVRMHPHVDSGNSLSYGIKITEIYVRDSGRIWTSIPAMTYADRFYYLESTYNATSVLTPDDSKIISFGIRSDISGISMTISRIDVVTSRLEYIKIGADRVNDMESYGDERLNPWVFTEGMIYEIQTQNNNSVVAMPLREILSLSSPTNGVVHTTSDVYLVFNLGQYIEKYYQHNLEDIGLNKDEGLPDNRRGDPSSLLSYPGRLLLSLDADDEYSTIMVRRSSAWHEIYRSPRGEAIHDMSIQVIPTMNTRLWVAQGDDLLWLPMPTGTWNPVQDDGFEYTSEGMLITGWISAGFLDIPKLWKSVKLYTENLVEDEQYITCEYQEDYGNLEHCTHWHNMEEQFSESPFQEIAISSGYDVSARRIRFRFKLHSIDKTKTPVLKAIIIECLLRFEVKNSYTFSYRLEDSPKDYSGANVVTRAEDIAAKLDEWSDTPVALTFRCNYSPFDDKIVVIEPYSLKPIEVESTNMLYEKHIGQITLLEI